MKLEPSLRLKTFESLNLSCKVQGTPVITVTWFKSGSEIPSDHRHTMAFDGSVASLVVQDCSVEDSGKYTCVASSEAGTDECHCSVSVRGESSFYLSRFYTHPLQPGPCGPVLVGLRDLSRPQSNMSSIAFSKKLQK